MKIGLVRRGYSPSGGAEAYLKRFAGELRRAGHQPELWTTTPWPGWGGPAGQPGDARDASTNATHGSPTGDALPPAPVVLLEGGDSPLAFAKAVEARRTSAAYDCDFLYSLERVWACDGYRAGDGVHRAWLRRRNAVEPFWRRWLRGLNGKHRELLALESRLFSGKETGAPGAGAIIANCRMVKEEIVREYGYPAGRIHVVHNGLPAETIARLSGGADPAAHAALRARTRTRLGLAESDYVLLFAGSGWERKGLRPAMEGVRLAREAGVPATLLVAGKGSQKRFPAPAACPSAVRFLGPVADMPAYLAAADVFLLPTQYDPFSNACLEGLAAGLPVITTTSNGFSEVMRPGLHGEALAAPAESRELAAAIARAIAAWAAPAPRAATRPQRLELAGQLTMEANLRGTLEAFTLAHSR